MHDFAALTITSVASETSDTIVVTFNVPDAMEQAFRFKPGQHLALRHTLGGEEIRRTYSICSGPEQPLAIAIKRVAGGLFSNWAHDTLKAGMALDVMPPQGRFVLPDAAGPTGHTLAFAAGSGITPIAAMIEHAMVRQPGTRFTLVYGNRDVESIVFRQRLEDLKDKHLGRLTLVHVLSRNEESETPLLEGRITAQKVEAFAGPLFHVDDVDQVYLCGPGSMIKDVRTALFKLGMARERVHHEFFAAGGGAYRTPAPSAQVVASSAAASPEGGTEIVALLDGVRHRFVAAPGESVVDAALKAGIRVPYACKGGMCSTCRAKLVSGTAPMTVNYSLEPWEVEKGFILTCQALPKGGTVVVDFDQM